MGRHKIEETTSKQRQLVATRRYKLAQQDVTITLPYIISDDRKACENDLELFAKTYLSHHFYMPNSPDQLMSLKRLQEVIIDGGQYCTAAPRADGKTSRTLAAMLWSVLYGKRKYVVTIAGTTFLAKKLINEIGAELATNEKLLRDWPDVCEVAMRCVGRPAKSKVITINGMKPGFFLGVSKIVLPSVPDYPTNYGGSIIECYGITGAIRGLRHVRPDGSIIRPDLALLDDPQSNQSAASKQQIETREELIQGAILGLSGPTTRIAAVANVTAIKPDDLSCRLLDHKKHPEWRGTTCKLIYDWPKSDKWTEYVRLRQFGSESGDFSEANDLYLKNREEMDSGANVSNPNRYFPGEMSAIQHAYNLLADRGKLIFDAEYQNSPSVNQSIYLRLTEDIISKRINKNKHLEIDSDKSIVTVFVDCGRSGHWWEMCAWNPKNLSGAIIAYGKYPEDGSYVWDPKKPNNETEDQAVFRTISELTNKICAIPITRNGSSVKIDCIVIDAGWKPTIICSFAERNKLPTMVVPSRGRASKNYKLNKQSIRSGENWMVQELPDGRQLIHNSDWYRLQTQQAIAMEFASPGSIIINNGPIEAHKELIKHLTTEYLAEYVRTDYGEYYNWQRIVGQAWHWSDCTVGCRVAASYLIGGNAFTINQKMEDVKPTAPTSSVPITPQTSDVRTSQLSNMNNVIRTNSLMGGNRPPMVGYDNKWKR